MSAFKKEIIVLTMIVLASKVNPEGIFCYVCNECTDALDDNLLEWCSSEPIPEPTTQDPCEDSPTDTRADPRILSLTDVEEDTSIETTIGSTAGSTTDTSPDTTTSSITETTDSTTDTSPGTTTSSTTESTTDSTTESTTDTTTDSTTESTTDLTTESTTDTTTDTTTDSTTESTTDSTKDSTTDTTTDTTTDSTTDPSTHPTACPPARRKKEANADPNNDFSAINRMRAVESVNRLLRNYRPRESRAAEGPTYHCFKINKRDPNGNISVQRGCIAVPEERGACEMLEEEYGSIQNCKICTKDKCNSGNLVQLSPLVVAAVVLISKFLK